MNNHPTFICLQDEKEYRLRLVGPYVKFHRNMSEGGRIEGQSKQTVTRFAINVIDRADGKMKILEAGNEVFLTFAEYKKRTDMNPAGQVAPNFKISISPMDGEKKQSVVVEGESYELTESDVALWKTDKAPLAELFKQTH